MSGAAVAYRVDIALKASFLAKNRSRHLVIDQNSQISISVYLIFICKRAMLKTSRFVGIKALIIRVIFVL